MTEISQSAREAAEGWRFIECLHCSQYENDFVEDLAADFDQFAMGAIAEAEQRGMERAAGIAENFDDTASDNLASTAARVIAQAIRTGAKT
jgi:hypothetical protein